MNAFFKASAIAAAAASLMTALPASAAIASYGAAFTAPGEQTYDHGRDRYRYSREDYRRGYGYRDRYDDRRDYRRSSWRGNDGRYYCRRSNGTTGLLLGGAAGALLGREVDGGRDRTAGTVIGAAAGALLGREVDRGGSRCR
ncbi:glycine zipper 2TM domain-containing protein [Novosphingobium gossypii]|uniref:glycine zipper 2TM domain-containing protein n=1 Tax=Novosphingobium gossypii TaxID=1604774 RepID=UPI003D211522